MKRRNVTQLLLTLVFARAPYAPSPPYRPNAVGYCKGNAICECSRGYYESRYCVCGHPRSTDGVCCGYYDCGDCINDMNFTCSQYEPPPPPLPPPYPPGSVAFCNGVTGEPYCQCSKGFEDRYCICGNPQGGPCCGNTQCGDCIDDMGLVCSPPPPPSFPPPPPSPAPPPPAPLPPSCFDATAKDLLPILNKTALIDMYNSANCCNNQNCDVHLKIIERLGDNGYRIVKM